MMLFATLTQTNKHYYNNETKRLILMIESMMILDRSSVTLLIYSWYTTTAPLKRKSNVRLLKNRLKLQRSTDWFPSNKINVCQCPVMR